MRSPIRTKLVLAFLVTVLLPLIGTGLYGNWITSQTLQTQALDNAQADLNSRGLQIEGYLKNVRENILFLSRLDSLQALINAHSPVAELKTAVESDFAAFTASHPGIFQTRFLDPDGMEVIRVEADAAGIAVVAEELLQNKADRYYFAATMALEPGGVFVSPLDLNREQDELQVPHTPTIRYATPLFRHDGGPAGLVIVNLFADPFLRFVEADTGDQALLTLVDEEGYYLVHPDLSKIFGGSRDLGSGAGFAADDWQAWESIRSAPGGIFAPPATSWLEALWDGLLPVGLLPFHDPAQGSRRVFVHQLVAPHGEGGPQWLLVQNFEHASLFAPIWSFRLTAILILLAASSLALLMAFSLARGLANPIMLLTRDVRRFVETRLNTGPAEVETAAGRKFAGDEIRELMAAFEGMSVAIDSHLAQLAMLNRAGHHIAARLEPQAVLEAACNALERLLPAEYVCFTLNGEQVHSSGDDAWAGHRRQDSLRTILDAAQRGSDWRTSRLLSQDGPEGYLCCTPLCVDGKPGLIEVYGADPILGKSSSGDLLATLATQISISLDNADLVARLNRRKTQLQSLVKQLIDAQEEERRVVAYDIHDGLIQMLVGARLHLKNFEAGRVLDRDQAEAALRKGLEELGAAIIEARRVIEGLRPALLDDFGLVPALREIADEVSEVCKWDLEFTVQPPNLRVPAMIETTAFRIAQEALTNARKYAGTERMRVSLSLEGDCLVVEVQDWGRGFQLEKIPAGSEDETRGLGLVGIQERARLVGGQCRIESRPGEGTRVWARLPLTPEASYGG